MTQVGYDARNHGRSPGATLDDTNVASIAYAGCTLDTTVISGGTLTFQGTNTIRATDNDTAAAAYIETITALSGDRASGMIYIPSCPTPGALSRIVQVRNAANNGDAVRISMNTSRQLYMYNNIDGVVIGPMTAIGAGAAVRIGWAFDLSDGDAWMWVYTTNPSTSTTPDQTNSNLTANWNGATDIGRVRMLAPHTSGIITIESQYAVMDDSTVTALSPLLDPAVITNDIKPASVNLTVSGGNTPHVVNSITKTGSGTSVGTMKSAVNGAEVHVWGTLAAVDIVTYDVTIDGTVYEVTFAPVVGSQGGPYTWDAGSSTHKF